MKKLIIAFFSLSLFTLILFLFSGCGTIDSYDEQISDLRYGIFDGQCENYTVTFTYGLREKPYLQDGIANPKIEFGILSVIFDEKVDESDTVYYSLKINENMISGTLEKSPYTEQYMADIGRLCSESDTLSLEVYFASDTNSQKVNLTNKSSDWEINYESALSNGIKALSDNIDAFNNKNLSYEIQVKVLNEQQSNFGSYFWSVTIISSSGIKHNVVFSTESIEVLLKN